jgi:hypothetical protein
MALYYSPVPRFVGSKSRRYPGRPRIDAEIEQEEALSKLILLDEASLRRVLSEYMLHFHTERNHQGKGNILLFPTDVQANNHVDGSVNCKERLGVLLKYYHREAA